jgi:nicotinate-nucleotide--dimethylbenzimidazole phosphoribosyltransferase
LNPRKIDALATDTHSSVPNRAEDKPVDPTTLLALAKRAQTLESPLANYVELDSFLTALGNGHVASSYGGDPVRNPESLPSGRNLYGFDPSRIPTQHAWKLGQGVYSDWLIKYRAEHNGAMPKKIAFSLWAGETMRHQGVMESQVLYALEARPVWDDNRGVSGFEIIPSEEQFALMNELSSIQISERIDQLCKPPGSLGTIESIAKQLCRIQQTLSPVIKPRHCSIFAADHGVTRQGVTSWPSDVTAAVTEVMGHGRTASGVFARSLDCQYEVIDVGILKPCSIPVINAAGRRSTGDLLVEPAMSDEEFDHAWQVGATRAKLACDAGCMLLIGGEMGIGNTTAASCIIGLFCDCDSESIVGRGAGSDDAGLLRKREVVAQAIARVRSLKPASPKQIGCEVGGLELVALAGFYHSAADRGRTVLLDGLIATAAALLADAMFPGTRDFMIAGHESSEPGHVVALNKLQLTPMLNLQMRLGEGTGALAALPLLDLAAAMMREMATLGELSFA